MAKSIDGSTGIHRPPIVLSNPLVVLLVSPWNFSSETSRSYTVETSSFLSLKIPFIEKTTPVTNYNIRCKGLQGLNLQW